MSVTCANGHTNLDGMAFCEECGVELTALTDRPAVADSADASSPSVATEPSIPNVTAPATTSDAAIATPTDAVATPTPESPGAPTLVPGDLPTAAAESTGEAAAPPAAPAAGQAYLEVVSGQFAGRRFPVTEPTCTIGRWDMDSGAFPEIDLTDVDVDAKVSRKHVRISKENDQFIVEDLGSLNGTSLNRAPRLLPGDRQVLRPNDELIVGRLFLKFVVA